MAKFRAKHNGWLPHGPNQGLTVKGDIVEWDGIRLLWLEPLDEEEQTEALTRKELIAELRKMEVKFYNGASTEQLQALWSTHKGIDV